MLTFFLLVKLDRLPRWMFVIDLGGAMSLDEKIVILESETIVLECVI